jgi:uncharacterized membrane protein YkoI
MQDWRNEFEPGMVLMFSRGSPAKAQDLAMLRAPRKSLALMAAALLCVELAAGPAFAERRRDRDRQEDQDAPRERTRARDRGGDQVEAREGVRNGRLVPLSEVLRRIARSYPGRMLDASLRELVPGSPVYVVIWLTPDGRRLTIWADARTGDIMRVEG